MAELDLHDDNDSAWILTYLVMPRTTQEAWRSLARKAGLDLGPYIRADLVRLVDHQRLLLADPAVDEILAMGRDDARRRAN